jgi:hypothetical protein
MPNVTLVITTGDATLVARNADYLWCIGGAELALSFTVAAIVSVATYRAFMGWLALRIA